MSMANIRGQQQVLRRVAEEEQIAGIKDQHMYKYMDGRDTKWVKVFLRFYPTTRWLVEDIATGSWSAIPNTRRLLTDDLRARLREWL